jgi:hypothetical protein
MAEAMPLGGENAFSDSFTSLMNLIISLLSGRRGLSALGRHCQLAPAPSYSITRLSHIFLHFRLFTNFDYPSYI